MRFFGTDGIRDRAGKGRLTKPNVLRVGRALATFQAPSPKVILGRDPRPSGPDLAGRLASALVEAGASVHDLGVVPTPVVAWSVATRGFDLGIAVSASHNPAEYNGIKPFVKGGRKLTEEEEARLEALMDADDGHEPDDGAACAEESVQDYVRATTGWLLEDGSFAGRRLVVDLAAGAASETAPEVLRGLGADVVLLHEAGSRDINAECGTEHPEAWLEAVRREGADAGLAFDGDADRVLVADPGGAVLDGDDALAILAEDWKRQGRLPGDVVVGTVMANLGLEERLQGLGVRLERTPVGDRHVAARMRELGAAVGAEQSGHVVLERDGALIGDGLVAGVRILASAFRLGRTLASVREATPRYPQVLRNVRVDERRPIEEFPALAEAIREVEAELGDRGRVVVRYSGTEPLLRIMVEAKDADQVERAVAHIEEASEGL